MQCLSSNCSSRHVRYVFTTGIGRRMLASILHIELRGSYYFSVHWYSPYLIAFPFISRKFKYVCVKCMLLQKPLLEFNTLLCHTGCILATHPSLILSLLRCSVWMWRLLAVEAPPVLRPLLRPEVSRSCWSCSAVSSGCLLTTPSMAPSRLVVRFQRLTVFISASKCI